MNPLTNVKNIQKLSELELKRSFKTSWHDQYKDSAWIFIGGLPYDLTEGDIICVFSQYGEVVNLNLVRDKSTGKSKGFCFLCYEDQRSTILAVDNFNAMKILGRTIRVDHVSDYKPPKESKNVDDVTKLLYETGCAPGSSVLSIGEPKKPEEKPDSKEGILQNVKKVKKKTAKKQKKASKKKSSKKTKKKRRKKKEESSSSSSSSSESESSSETSSESSSSEEEEEEEVDKGRKDKNRPKDRNKSGHDERELQNGRDFMEKVRVKMEEEEEEKRRIRREERTKKETQERGQDRPASDPSRPGREGREKGIKDAAVRETDRWKQKSGSQLKEDRRYVEEKGSSSVDRRQYEGREEREDRRRAAEVVRDDGRGWYDQKKDDKRERSEGRKDRRGDRRRQEERSRSPREKERKSKKSH